MDSETRPPVRLRPEVFDLLKTCTKKANRALFWFSLKNRDKDVKLKVLLEKVKVELGQSFKDRVFAGYVERKTTLTNAELHYFARVFRFQFNSILENLTKHVSLPIGFTWKQVNANGVSAEWQEPRDVKGNQTILYLHGGAFFVGSVECYRKFTARLADDNHARILSVDYRLAPEHHFPEPLEDCVAAYKWLLSRGIAPEDIIIAGDSAGGALALSTLLMLKRDGIPLPGAALCLSPAADFTYSGASMMRNAKTDPIVRLIPFSVYIISVFHASKAGPSNPLVSPLFGDYHGIPPILIQVSRHEMLHSDATRVADRAKADGVDVTLQEWDGMLHVFQAFGLGTRWPEVSEAFLKIKEFMTRIFGEHSGSG
jgi:monoterpene epsilon-lactone hydrolase